MTSIYKTLYAVALGAVTFGAAMPAGAVEAADSTSRTLITAYGTTDRDEVFGGVQQIDIESLINKNYMGGLNAFGNFEAYVAGYNGNSLWGQDDVLVLIDGVPRDGNNLSPTEIKSVTFLKGAQAVVLYGSRAAKGVILVTTKRGKESPLTVSVRANTGWDVAYNLPEYLGSAEYMTLYNEARANDGLAAAYSAEDIYRYGSHTNPYRYPDVNFYSDEYLKKAYNTTDATAEIYGGNERAKFYTNINYLRYGDYLNFGEAKKNYTDRLSIRGNVDLNISKVVSAYVDAAVTYYSARSGRSSNSYWTNAATLRPNRVAPLVPLSFINPDCTDILNLVGTTNNIYNNCFLAGTTIDSSNIFADYYAGGYNKYNSRQFQFDTGINLNLDPLVKGLTFNAQFAVDYATSYSIGYQDSYMVFIPEWSSQNGKDEILGMTTEGKDQHTGSQTVSGSSDRQTIHFAAHLDYDRTFNAVHNLSAMFAVAGWQRQYSGEYHRTSSANIGLQVDYNYDRRYYVTGAIAGLHSAKFAPGHRQAWSPSATIGWRISQENFMKDQNIFDELSLSASYSNLATDLDIEDYYMYAANYTQGGWFSWAPGGYQATYPARGSNDDLTFTRRKEFSVNLNARILNDMFEFNASYFQTKNTGLLVNNSTIFPTFFKTYYPDSSLVPWLNYNDDKRTGFDVGVKFNKTFDQVTVGAGVNYTYYQAKADKRDEIWEDEYQYREGKYLDAIWGYKCEGFFTSAEEIANWADQSALGGGNLQPGDLKYTDINGDGVINTQDQVVLGRGGWYGAPHTIGINLTAQYAGFTLHVVGIGNYGGTGVRNGYWWIKSNDKYSSIVRDRWTPETAATATYPRLTTTDGSNNYQTSDFWTYSTDRFRLAKVQLTYEFPKKWIHGPIVNGLEVYVSGSNLLSIGKNVEIMETNYGSAPASRFYNIGAKVTF